MGGGSPGGGGSAGGGSAGGTSTGGGAGLPTRFAATFTRFSVPDAVYGSLRGTSAQRSWSTLDLNGDRLPDLAVTSNPATGAVFSDALGPYWNVHLGSATGFTTIPLLWRVPEIIGAPQGYNTTDSASGLLHWSTFDISGDGRPEIVHTMNPISGGPYVSIMAEPADAWLSRRNVGSGFDTAGTMTLSVPRVTNLPGGIDRVASDLVGRRWTLAEVTGDTLVDLVITADPSTDSMWLTGGLSAWSVCPGSRLGFGAFSSNCALLTVPSNGLVGGFRSASSPGPARWFLLDLNGDRRDDLVWSTAATGVVFTAGTAPVWRVYLNQNSPTALFAPTFTQWALPGAMFNAATGAQGANQWATLDLDGDGLVELVHTADPATGRPFVTSNGPAWRLYPVTAARTGFSTTPTPWLVPSVTALPEGFRAVAGTSWAVLDVTGDGRPDLVEFQDPLTGRAFSDPRGAFWHVYPGVP